jgi:outer membrane protein insertion porin family
MFTILIKSIFYNIIIFFIFISFSFSEIIKEINIEGNQRISSETIIMFSDIDLESDLNSNDINQILKNLYNTNFFKNVELNIENNVLNIFVEENPIIEKITFIGIKAKKIKKAITQNINLKSRSSFNETLLKKDKENIINTLKNLGYYFSEIEISLEDLGDNKINITYKLELGDKSKIKKISYIGNKIYKDRKLNNIIVSEEYKFWKFISGRKFLNENTIELDKRLLKNFYLSKGYYDASINSSFAKLIKDNQFELIFNINPGKKYFFNNISLDLPKDFDEENFTNLKEIFNDIKGDPYSINSVKKILNEIDEITTQEEYHSISSTVDETLVNDQINLIFKIEETDKYFVERINIYGNNITHESVIRNQLDLDEGDPFNEILQGKSINNLKSLNFFKDVKSKINTNELKKTKTIDITVEEKATGEISAGAGMGTSGGTIAFAVKENNYLGKGISLQAESTIDEESIKGLLSITNPNFNNSEKSVSFSLQAQEIDRIADFGYKNNKIGFSIGTNFEYLNDFNLGLATSSFYEKIETDNTASDRQKKQEGNYFDTFLKLNFDYDKRNQNYQTSDGFRSQYYLDLPIISETNTITNSLDYKFFTELYEQNITSASILLRAAKSINNDNIKLSERLYIPSKRLRGFEKGKVGPKDGNDFIGGNFITTINFTSTIPQILENAENMDFAIFLDIANVWGVDYDSSLDSSDKVRSSIGIGIDWFTVLGPLNFSLATPLTKDANDKTESFRFNIGTAF